MPDSRAQKNKLVGYYLFREKNFKKLCNKTATINFDSRYSSKNCQKVILSIKYYKNYDLGEFILKNIKLIQT